MKDNHHPSSDSLTNDLAATVPQADSEFQQQLEDRLMLEMYSQKNERQNALIDIQNSPTQPVSKLPLTLAAAVLALIVVSSVLVLRSTPSSQPITGAQATDVVVSFESSFEYGGQVVNTYSESTISAMQRSGMTWMKYQEGFGTNANIENLRRAIKDAHDNNFKILLTLPGNPSNLNEPEYLSSYMNWLAEAARSGADAIEVWTEPNIDRSWPTGEINGAAYVDLLKQAYEAIKAANPYTLVISAAPAPTGAESAFPGQVMNDDRWLREVVESGGLDYLDCVGAQYVEGVIPPGKTSGDPRDNYYTRYFGGMVLAYEETLNAQKPLCFTSLGYLTDDDLSPLPAPFAWAENITVGQQAAWLGEAMRLASMSGRVQLIIVWNVDFTKYENEAPFAGYAMIRSDGSCPACDALEVFSLGSSLFPPSNLQPVIVAREDLKAGTQIDESKLTTVYWPLGSIPDEAASDVNDLVGQYLIQDTARWQPILKQYLSADKPPLGYVDGTGFIPSGWVGVLVPNEQISLDDALELGDRVDIVASFLFVDVDENVQSTSPSTMEPRLMEQNVIQGAGLIRIPPTNEIQAGTYMITVSPQDAPILNWLVDAQIPLMLIRSTD